MITGFTGSSRRISGQQKAAVLALVVETDEVHHGDCIVADEWVHKCATGLGKRVVIHPPDEQKARAFCFRMYPTENVTELPTRPYLDRDHDIVEASERLIAIPNRAEADGQAGGGVWATVRYARQANLPITIVRPDGTIEPDEPAATLRAVPEPEPEPEPEALEAKPKSARARKVAKSALAEAAPEAEPAPKRSPKAGVTPRPKSPSKRASKRPAVAEPEPEASEPEPSDDPNAEGRGKSW